MKKNVFEGLKFVKNGNEMIFGFHLEGESVGDVFNSPMKLYQFIESVNNSKLYYDVVKMDFMAFMAEYLEKDFDSLEQKYLHNKVLDEDIGTLYIFKYKGNTVRFVINHLFEDNVEGVMKARFIGYMIRDLFVIPLLKDREKNNQRPSIFLN